MFSIYHYMSFPDDLYIFRNYLYHRLNACFDEGNDMIDKKIRNLSVPRKQHHSAFNDKI
jgi:hypothetical protein